MSENDAIIDSLFARIGGTVAVAKAVEIFYAKVLTDTGINKFFEGIPMEKQKEKMRQFLTYAFGAKTSYGGKSLESAHAKLVENGLNDSHVDSVMEHFVATLKELAVPDDMIKEAAAIAESVRDDVLGK